jgi:formamidopyrimidine-DNA glycosylase
MPELPEVETVRLGLTRLIIGQKIKSVTCDNPKSFPNSEADVSQFVVGSKIIAVRRRAKVLIIDLDSKYSLVIHLKMTGQLVFRGKENFGAGHPTSSLIGNLPDRSTRVIICFEEDGKESESESNARRKRSTEQDIQKYGDASTGGSDKAGDQKRWQSFGLGPKSSQCDSALFFNDQRKFGWMRLIPTIEVENIDFFKKVGPEPLTAEFTDKVFSERLMRRKNSNIKSVLLDQTVLAGVGNIYADESLWGAKIHPSIRVIDIPKSKIKDLHRELLYVLKLSIEKGGSTDRNYVDAEGKKGSYMTFARVFRRENQACPRCGSIIIKTRVAGRGTHICLKCQKEQK